LPISICARIRSREKCIALCALADRYHGCSALSHSQIAVDVVGLGLDICRTDGFSDLAVLDDVVPVGQGGGKMEVLLHQHDGQTTSLEIADGLAQCLH